MSGSISIAILHWEDAKIHRSCKQDRHMLQGGAEHAGGGAVPHRAGPGHGGVDHRRAVAVPAQVPPARPWLVPQLAVAPPLAAEGGAGVRPHFPLGHAAGQCQPGEFWSPFLTSFAFPERGHRCLTRGFTLFLRDCTCCSGKAQGQRDLWWLGSDPLTYISELFSCFLRKFWLTPGIRSSWNGEGFGLFALNQACMSACFQKCPTPHSHPAPLSGCTITAPHQDLH